MYSIYITLPQNNDWNSNFNFGIENVKQLNCLEITSFLINYSQNNDWNNNFNFGKDNIKLLNCLELTSFLINYSQIEINRNLNKALEQNDIFLSIEDAKQFNYLEKQYS